MDSAGVSRHREGRPAEVRPGPRTRAAAVEADVHERRNRDTLRQQDYRVRRQNSLTSGTEYGASSGNQSAEGSVGSPHRATFRSTVNRHADRISRTLIEDLLRLDNADLRAAVLQKVFSHVHVRPLLPDYYPTPADAVAERNILNSIRAELQRTKIPQTSGKLARKRAILEAAVSEIDADFSKFHRIMGLKKTNFHGALERLRSASTVEGARFGVPTRRKRQGGISDAVRFAVTTWWTEETRVSPNRKDIRRKRLGCNLYDTHPVHLLMETQVSSALCLLHITCILYCSLKTSALSCVECSL